MAESKSVFQKNLLCSCGKLHETAVDDVIVEKGAVNRLPELLERYGAVKPFVLADCNTFAVAGEQVCRVLMSHDIPHTKYVFEKSPEPDEHGVGSAVMHFDASCDIIIGVGSGVINDISKIVSNTSGRPYIIVATAPSMDGYASATSSMIMDGLKVSLPSACAKVIVGDIDILKQAPLHMLKSGLGDMLAKYVSICEWRIAHIIVGEYYCEQIADMVRNALKKCIENAEGLLKREEVAVKAVFEGLVLGGIAMSYAGVSRPASGMEHYISHIWEMRALETGGSVELHGIQCAVGTLMTAGLYEQLVKMVPDKEKALAYAATFDYKQWSQELLAFLGKGAETMIALEEKEHKYDVALHAERLDRILANWDTILTIIKEELPSAAEIEKILDSIQAPKTPEEIGAETDKLKITLLATKDIRDKYVLSRLLWDLGIWDEMNLEVL
ncbi:MAG: sn-glycerol-1-phosphate dehydrogenase [Lachnospiraceae bacterium]|nr:sn-glycerol-1-phosphate dehydrogenase [Lachnospiraceae bacterium]